MHENRRGRCTTVSTVRSSADAFCANALQKASSGSQSRLALSGASFGACGCGSVRKTDAQFAHIGALRASDYPKNSIPLIITMATAVTP
jgi:hypothetical protein